MGIVLQYRFLHHPVRKNYTTEITWPCKHCLCLNRPVCGAFSFSQVPLFQDFGSLRPPSFCQYSSPRRSAALMESRFRFYRCALQGSRRRCNLSALIGSRLCGLRWLKIFLSLFSPWYFLFVWLQSYLHQLLSNGYVILPSTFHGKKVDRVQPKFLFLHFPKEKSYGLQPKSFSLVQRKNYTRLCAENLSSHFFSRKNAVVTTENFIPSLFMAKAYAVERLNNKEFTGCSNICEGITRKKKAGKGLWYPLPAAVYIFEIETGSCDPVSDDLTLLRF